MYDKTQEPNEFTGESAADATQQAARFFGLEEAELTVVVAAEGAISGAAGRTVVSTREPGGSPGGEEIRGLIVSGAPDRWDAVTEALLIFAARRDHVERLIKPALARGTLRTIAATAWRLVNEGSR